MREHLDRLVKKYGDGDITTMRVDNGVYVYDFYIDEDVSRKKCAAAVGKKDLSPLQQGGSSASDGCATE
eukprot:11075477-Karenia_brevis.AAC.1